MVGRTKKVLPGPPGAHGAKEVRLLAACDENKMVNKFTKMGRRRWKSTLNW